VSQTCTVRGCDRPTQTNLCGSCLTELVTALRHLAFSIVEGRRGPGLVQDLQDTAFRRDNLGPGSVGVRSRLAETPAPFHEAAAAFLHEVRYDITRWARNVAATYPHLTLTATTIPKAAEWMATFPNLLAEHPYAHTLHAEIVAMVRQIRRMIDRAPDKVYLGQCGFEIDGEACPQDLYVLPSRDSVHCPTCGSDWDTQARREHLLRVVEDQLATAAEVSQALSRLARPVSAAAIRSYVHRGKLDQHPPLPQDPKHRPLYRIGDVLDLLHQTEKEAS
jgi:hypothetical protein